ncbi:MAG: serine/threonine protein kinase [Myxococcaceae bacterium]|nr:serine/threonine protein kinase [Myxococcaceae bacterium]
MSAQPYLRPTSALDRRTMGKYDVLCRLSTGGMSEIFLAYQKGLAGFRKIVVLKSILPDIRGEEEFVRMFLDEAKTTALFNHPHIAQVFDLDVDTDTLFLAMEFVQGCTLVEMARACRQAKEPIPIGFTLLSVRDTALALHYAHTFTDPRGRKQVVIHRDVAEKNIMVTYDGTTKLLDFGIAKALGKANGRTTVGMVKGTSGYMSPEQIRGEPLDARSDVFSLGVVLHECLTGMRLFHGKTPEEGMLSALREEIPPPSRLNPDVSPAIDAVVLKALTRERDLRFNTSLEFARAVEKAAMGQMWHPEQSGELVMRHFEDRVKQTRELIESTQAGENTGELKVGKLLQELQNARETGVPVDRERTRTDPGDKPMTPPMPSANRPTPVQVTTQPPRPKESGNRGNLRPLPPPPVPEVTSTGETREVTDPAAVGNPPLPQPRSSLTSLPVQLTPQPAQRYDDDDVGAKTIPAAMLPNGLFAPPAEVLAAQTRRPNPLPPPVVTPPPAPPAPASLHSTDETTTGGDKPAPKNGSGWETYDDGGDEDDDPGIKTTIARPFDDERTSTTPRGRKRKLGGYVAGGLFVGLGALGALMFVLELGPFAQPRGPQPPVKFPTAEAQPEPAPAPTPTPKKEPVAVKKVDPPPAPVEPVKPPAAPEPAPEPAPAPTREPAVAAVVEPPPAPAPAPETKPKAQKTERTNKRRPPGKRVASKEPEEDEPEPAEAAAKAAPAVTGNATLTLVMEAGLLVTLNGTELGQTPLFTKPVPVGRQVFKIFAPSGEARTLAIDIKPGANSSRHDFESLGR